MPYVPSEKTDGKSQDRNIIDAALEPLAEEAAVKITTNRSVLTVYKEIFYDLADCLDHLTSGKRIPEFYITKRFYDNVVVLAQAIFDVGAGYNYDGAYLGELNYAVTRFIQRVPQIKVKNGTWTQELRYWYYAMTVAALVWTVHKTHENEDGIGGVFEDIKDEYKRRVNAPYEAAQIEKSGDCYDAPYYTRLVEVVDEGGGHIGHMEVMLKRDPDTVNKDMLNGQIILTLKEGK